MNGCSVDKIPALFPGDRPPVPHGVAVAPDCGEQRWLAIHLPALPLEVFERSMQARGPLVISNGALRTPAVLFCNPAARQAGITPGMSVSAALALAADVQVQTRNDSLEAAALAHVAAWAGQFTSFVSLSEPQGLLLEIAGSLKLFGGLDALCQRIREGLDALGYQACMSIAPVPLGALLLARSGDESRIMDPVSLPPALARLTLSQLGLGERASKRLRGMGLRCVRDLMRLPRDGLAERLGPDFIDMLDRLFGRTPDPRKPWQPPPRFESRLPFPAEITSTEALLFPARRLLEELVGQLRARCAGVSCLQWRLGHHQGASTVFSLGLLRLTRDTDYLMDLLRERLERLTLPGAVEDMTLVAERMPPLSLPGADLFAIRENDEHESGLQFLERLRNRLGADAINGIRLVPEHRPEYAWRSCEPTEAGNDTVSLHAGTRRPVWLLDHPVVLGVVDGKPCLEGVLVLQPVRERIETGWWDGRDIRRDYFIATNARGGCFWVFREAGEKSRWFLHGIAG